MRGAPLWEATVHGHGAVEGSETSSATDESEAAEPLDADARPGHVRRKPVAEQLPELDGVAAPCPHRQHGPDVRDGEAELAEVEDELELLEGRAVVPAMSTLADRDGLQESLLLVEADRADGLPRGPSQVSRGEHVFHVQLANGVAVRMQRWLTPTRPAVRPGTGGGGR
jgi:hypothetical protein